MMSNGPNPSLQTLPVEILHRIFDGLDASTILVSLGSMCRQFRTTINSYDRYILNFQSIAKSNLRLVCRLVDPQNVISLTLFQDDTALDQIELILPLFDIQQLNRLRSLTLLVIEECQLEFILERINTHSLISFALKIRNHDDRLRNKTATLLSSLIAQVNLFKLELDVRPDRIEKILWPDQHMIQQLRMGTSIAFDNVCSILRCSPHLRTLVISSFSMENTDQTDLVRRRPTPFRQLISLTFERLDARIDRLELFLSLTPSLTYLRLIGFATYLNGNRWEKFIQNNLPLLNKFEFFFKEWRNIQYTPAKAESIIASFRTPFWLEQKRWFVTCEYNIDRPRWIQLYSIPVCVSSLIYDSESQKISLSNIELREAKAGNKRIKLTNARYNS